jgi:hypothetical protein
MVFSPFFDSYSFTGLPRIGQMVQMPPKKNSHSTFFQLVFQIWVLSGVEWFYGPDWLDEAYTSMQPPDHEEDEKNCESTIS